MTDRGNEYGIGDTSYQMAGELAGITQLVTDFYRYMDQLTEAQKIRAMHRDDLSESQLKLVYFLSGWLGGPKRYAQHYGSIHIPAAHQHLKIGIEDRDAWLLCMQKAVDKQPYDASFKVYLMAQFLIPAQRITAVCAKQS